MSTHSWQSSLDQTQFSQQIISQYRFDVSKENMHGVRCKRQKTKCDLCDKSYVSKHSLTSHVSRIHEGKKPFKCDICDANFTQKPNLKQHIESDNEGKKPFKCDMCDTSFVFKH